MELAKLWNHTMINELTFFVLRSYCKILVCSYYYKATHPVWIFGSIGLSKTVYVWIALVVCLSHEYNIESSIGANYTQWHWYIVQTYFIVNDIIIKTNQTKMHYHDM